MLRSIPRKPNKNRQNKNKIEGLEEVGVGVGGTEGEETEGERVVTI